MLFDLYHDPLERVNLVDDPRYEAVYKDLSQRLRDWMEQTEDPLYCRVIGYLSPRERW